MPSRLPLRSRSVTCRVSAASYNWNSGTHFDAGSSQEASLSATSEAMAAETKALEQEPTLMAVAAVIGSPVRIDFTP